ncbi:MAG: tetratricopeptide repeat protein [Nitrosomonadales bacterium]|nr:tetratricopeptide repeat protein [Nitrosomonadales bacterium]
MAIVSAVSDKWVLVIDDMEGMRAQLRMALSSAGFAKLHLVGNIRDALEYMAKNRYDVVLCDYSLGDSTDGQQFLEYLRTNDLIARNTIFVMITAEQSYEKVVTASECAPDDYLLKPFTASQFNARLEKQLERQEYFTPIDKATDEKNWLRVIDECNKKLATKDKYYFELIKIKASALVKENRPQEAADLYREILALRPIGWARLGLARTLVMQGSKLEAQVLLQEIIADSPQFLAAYDLLARLLNESGDKQESLNILQKAREISPGTMSRVRELSTLAVSAGKPEIAEAVLKQALKKHKYSPVRQANDYAVLSTALVNQGKAKEALTLMDEVKTMFNDETSNVVIAATESVAHRAAGNTEQAEAALARAMSSGDRSKLPVQAMVSLANACYALGKEKDATDLLRHVVQNNQDDSSIKGKVHDVLVAAGKNTSEADAMIEESMKEVIMLNNNGVRKAEAGQLTEAIELLCQAADRLPNNLQFVGNASLVIALDIVRNGSTSEKLSRFIRYRDALKKKSPNHPKLAQIENLLKQMKK